VRAITLCVSLMFVGSALAADYIHTSSGRSMSIRSEQQAIAIGDIGYDANFCDASTGMVCLRAHDFRFSIPIDAQRRSTWVHDGVAYSAKAIDETIFGRPGPYWMIKQEGRNGFEFIYSDRFGLIALQKKTGTPGAYLLMQPCGFAAPPDC
jgi:hypothetical protein